MAINYITTANTFQQWVIGTQDLITVANNLTDNISGTFYANTNLVVGNTLNVVGDTTISGNLTVSGNIVLDTIGFDDINANGSINVGNTLFVTGNTTLSNANVTNTLTANIAQITTATITTGNITTGNITTLAITTANIVSANIASANINGTLYVSGDAIFGGNVTLDAVGFDDLTVTGNSSITLNETIGGTLTVTGNTTLSNANVTDTLTTSKITSSGGLITVSSNTFVNDWVFSPNANVKSGVTTFSVVNSGSSAYLFDQYSGNNPDIYLHPGQTVSFNINASGHPFLIRQSNAGALYNVGLTHVSTAGVVTTEGSAQGQVTGTLIWKVPASLTGNTYVYQCQNHSGMVGNLIIQSTVTAAITTANAAFVAANTAASDGLAFAVALG